MKTYTNKYYLTTRGIFVEEGSSENPRWRKFEPHSERGIGLVKFINCENPELKPEETNQIVSITCLKRGQDRPYGDSYYYFDIDILKNKLGEITKENVKSILSCEYNFEDACDTNEATGSWWQEKYTLKETRKNHWEYRGCQVYLD